MLGLLHASSHCILTAPLSGGYIVSILQLRKLGPPKEKWLLPYHPESDRTRLMISWLPSQCLGKEKRNGTGGSGRAREAEVGCEIGMYLRRDLCVKSTRQDLGSASPASSKPSTMKPDKPTGAQMLAKGCGLKLAVE